MGTVDRQWGVTYFDSRAAAERLGHEPLSRAGRSFRERPESYLRGRWEDRHPLNVPGPFYGAATDTCCDGPPLAPASLLYDDHGQGFVWRQPRNDVETHALMCGMSSDPFSGYAWDGDDHWTPDLVRGWWADRESHRDLIDRLVHVVSGPRPVLTTPDQDLLFRCLPLGGYTDEERAHMRSVVGDYLDYRRLWMQDYLRSYLYFLDHGRFPHGDATLPSL